MFLFDIDSLRAKQADINTLMEEQSFWEDSENANTVLQENKYVTSLIDRYDGMNILSDELSLMLSLIHI